jgi:ABC-2 type transport system ATP-binding protein
MSAIELRGLTKVYDGSIRALDSLTFAVPQGSIFGFLGLNGAGKTTTINIIAGLLRQDAGTMSIFGREISSGDYEYKRQIGFVLDRPLYFEEMTGEEYLNFVAVMYDLPTDEAEKRRHELFEFFDLNDRQYDPIENYSTGMRKKISLAAAIIHRPKLVILDEPLEGIDALSANAIKETLRLMANKGETVFITSHVLDTIERICDEIAIIDRGKLLFQCPTEEIQTKVKSELSQETFSSLEELFIELVAGKIRKKNLSWL